MSAVNLFSDTQTQPTEAMRAATDGCQAAFNKASMRVLIDRLVQTNRRLAQAA